MTPPMADVVESNDAATDLATRIMALPWRSRDLWTVEEQADRHGELQEMIAARLSQAGAGGVDDGLSAAEKFDLAQSLATELGYRLVALAASPSAGEPTCWTSEVSLRMASEGLPAVIHAYPPPVEPVALYRTPPAPVQTASVEAAIEALEQCEEYFDNRADADCEGDPAEFVPNKEMRLLSVVRDALASLTAPTQDNAKAYEQVATAVLDWLTERGLYDARDYADEGPNVAELLSMHETELLRPKPTPSSPVSSPSPAGGEEPDLWSPKLEAIRLLAAEDKRQLQLLELLETIREQIRLSVQPEHRPEGLFKNIQDAVYALRGRLPLLNDAAIMAPLQANPPPAGGVREALDREWLKTEISAIDLWYRGDPSYMRDAYWMKDQVLKLLDHPGALSSPAAVEARAFAIKALYQFSDLTARHWRNKGKGGPGFDDELERAEHIALDAIAALSPATPEPVSAPAGEVVEALKPFADEAADWGDRAPDGAVVIIAGPCCDEPVNAKFTVGDLRRAARVFAALNPAPGHGEGGL